MSEQILEEMRERLAQKGAFDMFKRKKDEDTCGTTLELKVAQLKKAIDEREKEPFLVVEPVDHVLSDVDAKDLSRFFSKKEIDDLVSRKYPMIKTGSTIRNTLIALSQLGVVPKKPHRLVKCLKCGITKEFVIDLVELWEKTKQNFYCENCKKEIEQLNEKQTQVSLLSSIKKT